MKHKDLGLYVLVGVISGGLCTWIWGLDPFPDEKVKFHLLAIIFAIAILVAGHYISDIQIRSGWFSVAILIAACAIGWHFAYKFGYKFHTHELSPIGSSAIGGICVSIGLALAWKLRRPIFATTVITMASVLGGFLLIFLDLLAPTLNLIFITWQGILLLAIGITVQIDSDKSSDQQ